MGGWVRSWCDVCEPKGGYRMNVWIPKHEKRRKSISKGCYAERRGAKRDAGTDECFVTNVGGARDRLVLGRFRRWTEMDT